MPVGAFLCRQRQIFGGRGRERSDHIPEWILHYAHLRVVGRHLNLLLFDLVFDVTAGASRSMPREISF
jgi:hypothetical protein